MQGYVYLQYTFEKYSTAKVHLKHGIFANIVHYSTFNLAQENQRMAFIYLSAAVKEVILCDVQWRW